MIRYLPRILCNPYFPPKNKITKTTRTLNHVSVLQSLRSFDHSTTYPTLNTLPGLEPPALSWRHTSDLEIH